VSLDILNKYRKTDDSQNSIEDEKMGMTVTANHILRQQALAEQLTLKMGFCAHFSEKSKVSSQAFSYKGFRRVVANKKTPEGAFLNSNIVTKSSTFHVHKMYSCWSDSC